MDDLNNGSTKSLTFIKAIILIAKGLSMKVVAEGIETKKALEIFKTQGGDIVQGYYFSKPLLADTFLNLLKEQSEKRGKV